MQFNLLQRGAAVLLLVMLLGAGLVSTRMTEAQDATPAPAAGLPEGPLGTQIQWLVDYINTPEGDAASVDLTTIFAPWVLADVPAPQLQQILNNIRTQLAPVTVDTETMVTTANLPPTTANFYLVGADGTQLPTTLSVDPTSGMISSIWFAAPIAPAPTTIPTETLVPTATSTATATIEPTETATLAPTETPTEIPTETATLEPTETPTLPPTETATPEPTETPTLPPTETATLVPTETATLEPTETPTETATSVPTETATPEPTETPTSTATLVPTETATPTEVPTETATATLVPTETATATLEPTETATATKVPTRTATATEEPTETATATLEPTETSTATKEPTETATATAEPSETPTATEAPTETATATLEPTETATATQEPTETATEEPTETASPTATEIPTEMPTETAAPTETTVVIAAASPIATEAATESASPIPSPVETATASPVASEFPSGPLGEQAAWTWSILSNGGAPVPASEIESHFTPEFLSQVPAEKMSGILAQLQAQHGPFTLVPDSMLVSENEPPTNLSYQVEGQNGARFQVSVSIDPETGRLNGFIFAPAGPPSSAVTAVLPAGMTDTEVSFTSGNDTLYGSFLAPSGLSATGSAPAALIISGSGPTDRNGNSAGFSMNTNLNLAITLAQEGIPSLRYDKLGSGQTGLASHADGSGIDYELFLQEARDAAAFLSQQPGVDPGKLILVGHSEGALFALVLAREMADAGTPPAAVILAAPLSERYLDVIHEQITKQIGAAVTAQTLTQDEADKIVAEMDSSIDRLRTTGTLPTTVEDPGLAQIFSQANAPFLSQIDKIDPSEVAASLPSDLPVLVLLGFKDAQVTGDQVRHLMDGFRAAGNDNVRLGSLPRADHTLRIIEGDANPAVDYANPDLEFSPEAVAEIDAFLQEHGLNQGA